MNPILLAIIIVASIGFVAGLGLSICSMFMHVKSNEKIEKVREMLPGANCGACGYSGCDLYAKALINGETKPGLCAPGGVEINDMLAEFLGVKPVVFERKTATVLCNGTTEHVKSKMFYVGVETCKAANMLYGGTLDCNYGCLGLGDCAKSCQYGAITVKDGRAVVDQEKCTACSTCVASCPKKIIELLPYKSRAVVLCSNCDKGAVARKACEVACIACGKCVKACEYGAVKVENNLARIDPYKCVACGLCVDVCPMNCIAFEEK